MSDSPSLAGGQRAAERGTSSTKGDNSPPLHAEQSADPVFVHPDARALFKKAPFLRYMPLFGQVTEGYGPKVTISLALSYFLCKGTADHLIRDALFPLMTRYYHVDGMVYQRLSNVVNMGWSLKTFTALVSDLLAFWGYTKRWYMFGSCLLGGALTIGIGFLPGVPRSSTIAAGMAFIFSFAMANVDILSDGLYSRMMRRLPGPGPALVSWIWWFIMIGSLVSSVITGPLADAGKPYVCAFIAAGLQLLACFIFPLNWYGEKPNREERFHDAVFMKKEKAKAEEEKLKREKEENKEDSHDEEQHARDFHPRKSKDSDGTDQGNESALVDEIAELDLGAEPCGPVSNVVLDDFVEPVPCCCGVFEVNRGVLQRSKKLTAYSVLMGCGVIAMAIVSTMGTTIQLLITCVVTSVFLCCFNFYALPLIIAKATLYSFLQPLSVLQFPGALSSFYTATPDCLPDGPNFNFFFFNTVSSVIMNVMAICAIALFNYVFSKRSYRLAFISTTILRVAISITDVIVVNRWNRPAVSDHVMYIFGEAIVGQITYMMNYMPMMVLISNLCPRGKESMTYAIVAGFANLGQSMAASVGSIIMELKWPVRTTPPCDFSNLWKIVVLSDFVVQPIQIPLCLLLIPSARLCDDLHIELDVLRSTVTGRKKNKKKGGFWTSLKGYMRAALFWVTQRKCHSHRNEQTI